MPSPLNGLMDPAASPTTAHVGPTFGLDRAGHRDAGRRSGAQVGFSGSISQYSGSGGRPLLHEVRGVDALEVAERRQQADADVDRPVADREDPAVAGQRVAVAVAHVEGALDPRLGVQRALEVVADRHALRVASGSGPCPAPGRTGSWRRRRSRRSGRGSCGSRRSSLSFTTAPRTSPPRTSGCDGLGALEQGGAGLHGVLGDDLVEVTAAHDEAVVGEHPGAAGHSQLEGDAVGDGPQPVVAVVVAEPVVEAHVAELLDRPRA